MKRSEINAILADAEAFFERFGQKLPPFAAWTAEDWRARRAEAGRILDARLGWDITDFGRGDFARFGLVLFTVRNGRIEDLKRGAGRVYAEKAMIVREGQVTPMHRHVMKTEDIINKGGATLAVKVFLTDAAGGLDHAAPVVVETDGTERRLSPGDIVRLGPGESITLVPGVFHAFWGEGGDVFVGEVSTVNDDERDNIFAEPVARFPEIDEDEPPRRRLVSEYGRLS
jgi:D-lyxose ketol-isomerase